MNMFKKIVPALGVAFASFASFADDATSSSGIVSASDLTDIFTEAQTNMTSLIDAALPVIIAFVGGGLLIWGALALVSLLKRGFGAGKGR